MGSESVETVGDRSVGEGVAEPVCSSVQSSEVFICQWRCSDGSFGAQDPICFDLLHRIVVIWPVLQARM